MLEVLSEGYDAGNYAEILMDYQPVGMEKNSNNHYRGLHIVILNQKTGLVKLAKIFDTYKSSKELDFFIEFGRDGVAISNGDIVAAAC